MRLSVGVMVECAAALMAGAAARAQSPFYVSGDVGGYFRESESGADQFHHSDAPTVIVGGTDRRAFDDGVIGHLALGYRLAPHIRVEAEFGYITYTGSTLNPQTSAPGFAALNGQTFHRTSGDRFTRYTGTANVFYDFSPLAGRFTPYVGGGIGASADHQSFGVFAAADGTPFRSSGGSSTQSLGLVEAGVAIALTPRLSIVPAYRYTRFFADNEDSAHVVKLGLRYSF